jgi:hypothetical protein
MIYPQYEAQPLPEAPIADPAQVLEMYEAMLRYDIPGLVIRGATLDDVDDILLPRGLVTPANAFNNPHGQHEDTRFANSVQYTIPEYHVDGLPTQGMRSAMHHHETTRSAHELTLATFAPGFISHHESPKTADGLLDAIVQTNRHLEATLRAGVRDPDMVGPHIYRGRVNVGEVVAIRIMGESPTIHDFRTITEVDPQRGAIVRGYTALPPR